jgi:glucose-6-phosphate dehydrogenase assembly protein OpcA
MTTAGATSTDTPAWSGERVAIADVVAAVDDLRRREQRAATRASVATLIIVTRNVDELDQAETVIEHLGVRHPARIITLLSPHGAEHDEDRVDADVVLHSGHAAGHDVWSDELRLRVGGGPSQHLASLLRPLLLSDLPVIVWYVSGLPNEADPILKLSNAIIVDSKTPLSPDAGEPEMRRVFTDIVSLCRKHTVIDLSWSRLATWRRLLATQFQGEIFGPMVHGIERVSITGKLGPRTLLAGWIGSRLALPRDGMHLYDGKHVSVTMHSRVGNQTGEFTVERVPDDRLVRASGQIHEGASHSELLALPDVALPASLSGALRRVERDKVYELAIKTVGLWL